MKIDKHPTYQPQVAPDQAGRDQLRIERGVIAELFVFELLTALDAGAVTIRGETEELARLLGAFQQADETLRASMDLAMRGESKR